MDPGVGHRLRMIGRLKAGVSQNQGMADLAWIAKTRVAEFPRPRWVSLARGLIVDSLQDDVTRAVKPVLLAIFGAVILVLLIACVNVTNLFRLRRPSCPQTTISFSENGKLQFH
jgi:putative ABC transport system permease protein